jgi:hypothetical protein
MASVDTEFEMALRAKTREELAVRAEKLLEQSRALKDRLAKSLADRTNLDEEEMAEREHVVEMASEMEREHVGVAPLEASKCCKTTTGVLAASIILVCSVSIAVVLVFVYGV